MSRGADHAGRTTGVGALALLATAWLMAAAPASALEFADVKGHLLIGFSHVSTSDSTDTPAGSISIGGGVDIPVADRFRAGIDLGYHLLGSRTLEQGSLTSGLDYSVFEVLALAHWSPLSSGPDLTISGGPGLFMANAELAATSVGLAFVPLAVNETTVGAALSVGVAKRTTSPVRAGLDLGLRWIPLEDERWTLFSARIVVRY